MRLSNFWKILLAALAFLLISMPVIQGKLRLVEEYQLTGAVAPIPPPEWSWENWFSGSFQEEMAKYLNEQVGFRSTLVRINSQVKWSLFGEASGDAVAGENGFLYTQAYINAYLGRINLGMDYNRTLSNNMKLLQDELAGVGTPMYTVLAPGKATFFPEHLPQRERPGKQGPSTYEQLKDLLPAAGVNFVDMDHWFRQMKDTASYPLFPQGGVHWSDYGKFLAADSLVHLVEQMTGDDLPELTLDTVRMGEMNIRSDYDVGATMNLFWRSPTYAMPYPKVRIQKKKHHRPLRVIVVGDSYYLCLHDEGMSDKVFGNGVLWYYSRTIFPIVPGKDKLKYVNVWQEMVAADAVIVMATVANANDLGWGIYNKVMQSKYGQKKLSIKAYEDAIREDAQWMKTIKLKAKRAGVSIDEMINLDAQFMANQAQAES